MERCRGLSPIKTSYKQHKELLTLQRMELAVMMGWITGHCYFNRHLRGPNIKWRSCRFCDKENESTEHILWKCPAVDERRLRYLGRSSEELSNPEIIMKTAALARFIKVLGLLDQE